MCGKEMCQFAEDMIQQTHCTSLRVLSVSLVRLTYRVGATTGEIASTQENRKTDWRNAGCKTDGALFNLKRGDWPIVCAVKRYAIVVVQIVMVIVFLTSNSHLITQRTIFCLTFKKIIQVTIFAVARADAFSWRKED